MAKFKQDDSIRNCFKKPQTGKQVSQITDNERKSVRLGFSFDFKEKENKIFNTLVTFCRQMKPVFLQVKQ